jgi:hypothetical protein
VAAPASGQVAGDLWISKETRLPVLFRSVTEGRPVAISQACPRMKNVIVERFLWFGKAIHHLSLPAVCFKG